MVSREEADTILKLPISSARNGDFLVWHFNSQGRYTVKSGYHLAMNDQREVASKPSSSFQPPKAVWKFIWNLQVPPKLKHFWWRACSNLLATKENRIDVNSIPPPVLFVKKNQKLVNICSLVVNGQRQSGLEAI